MTLNHYKALDCLAEENRRNWEENGELGVFELVSKDAYVDGELAGYRLEGVLHDWEGRDDYLAFVYLPLGRRVMVRFFFMNGVSAQASREDWEMLAAWIRSFRWHGR